MQIKVPNLSLVVLIGPSGSGKSTFARKHFLPTEILSSDACRAMVSDDENDQAVTKDAFDVLRFIAGKRLTLGRLTVIDATNVQPEARSRSSSWPGSITAFPWPSCSTCRRRSARSEIGCGPTANLALTLSAINRRNCGGRSACCARRAFGTSS